MTDLPHILLVEDDASLAQWVSDYLSPRGYKVSICERGDSAVEQVRQRQPDLLLLDGMLPGLDGLEVCKAVRPFFNGPILMLTARDEEIDEVLGLEVGADDYLTKPVKPRVLMARIKVALRRQQPAIDGTESESNSSKISISGLEIVKSARNVSLHGESINISSNEFDLLWVLAEKAGEVVDREYLVTALRGFEYDGFDRSIDQRVSRLRKKLGDNPTEPFRIKTIWGKGYLLVKDAW